MQTQSAICTVFEGHYHKGVAALINSLHANGYEGNIWIGYKGSLPPWATVEKRADGSEEMGVTDKLVLRFVKFAKEAFLPYIKPDFMLQIFEQLQPEAERVFYFDCDILVKCTFSYFDEWANYGIALCEDVNSPISKTDPLRFQWANYFKNFGIAVKRDSEQYVNGGFLGLNRSAKGFLKTWAHVQDLVLQDMERINVALHNSHLPEKISGLRDRTYMFNRTDQDALNIAKDSTDEVLAIADSSAMDFRGVGFVMSHAASKVKPWEKNWLMTVIKNGQRPSPTDRLFMDFTSTPINIYSDHERMFKKVHLKIATAVGRVLAG